MKEGAQRTVRFGSIWRVEIFVNQEKKISQLWRTPEDLFRQFFIAINDLVLILWV